MRSGTEKLGLILLRLGLGWIFLWAFIDKLWGLGFGTPFERAWLQGGSPTSGFLSNASGPFLEFFNSLAGQPWVDWLFMIGLLGIGLALILGIAVRFGSFCGIIMMVLMYMAALPLVNNPFMDNHLIYAFAFLVIGATKSGNWAGLGKWWSSTSIARTFPFLK